MAHLPASHNMNPSGKTSALNSQVYPASGLGEKTGFLTCAILYVNSLFTPLDLSYLFLHAFFSFNLVTAMWNTTGLLLSISLTSQPGINRVFMSICKF